MSKRKLWADLALILALLILAGGAFLWLQLRREVGGYVIVRVDGRETGRYSLASDGSYSLNGGTNILVIQNGEAYLSDADCPDKLCVKQGRVRYAGQCITCLPNKLTVTVYGGDGGMDLVS